MGEQERDRVILLLEGDSWLAADGASGIGRGGGGGQGKARAYMGIQREYIRCEKGRLKRELVWFSEIFPSILVPSQTEN